LAGVFFAGLPHAARGQQPAAFAGFGDRIGVVDLDG